MRNTISLLFIVSLFSCLAPKESRLLKKETKEWRESKIVLKAYLDTPLNGVFLELRENGTFEHFSSGIFKSLDTGYWSCDGDTITLYYIDLNHEIKETEKVIMDVSNATLQFEGHTDTWNRMRILVNAL